MSPDLNELARSAGWHLYDLDAEGVHAKLLRLTEADFRAASFLDARAALPQGKTRGETHDVAVQEFASALAMIPKPPQSPHLIFHLGHCGSTLISRALAATPSVLPLREPLTLRRLAEANLPGRVTALVANLLPISLAAHARVFQSGQRAMIKATSTCSALAIPALEAHAGSRALLIYVTLETYLAGMLGKLTPPTDLSGQAAFREADWSSIPGAPEMSDASPAIEVSDPLVHWAVIAWLTGMRHLAATARAFPNRTRLLDFQEFLGAPDEGLRTTSDFFGLGEQIPELLAAWPDISSGYSKQPDQAYSAFNRRKTLQRGRLSRAAEIAAGLKWTEALVSRVEALEPCGRYLR